MLNESTKVNATNYNFTWPNTAKFYSVVQPQTGSSRGDHRLNVTFRYYEYDPKCHYYQDWIKRSCVNNYTRYCAELTDYYRQELNNPDLLVFFNGTACVVSQNFTERVENIIENVTEVVEIVEEGPSEEYLAEVAAREQAIKDAKEQYERDLKQLELDKEEAIKKREEAIKAREERIE